MERTLFSLNRYVPYYELYECSIADFENEKRFLSRSFPFRSFVLYVLQKY